MDRRELESAGGARSGMASKGAATRVAGARERSRPAAAGSLTLARGVAAFGLALTGMLVIGTLWHATSACWIAWVATGILAGLVSGRGRDVLTVPLALLVFYAATAVLGAPSTDVVWLHWAVLNLVGAAIVASGFVLATLVPLRGRAGRRAGRGLVAGSVALALLGVSGWAAYAGEVGSEEMVHPTGKWEGCDTPMSRFGWAYEAVNYDPADDARLLAANPDTGHCASQGTPAGTAVVTRDGVGIAGWYIPAARGADPAAPTIVIVPGWRSNKSEILKYGPPFHERFNLLLVDLRNQGRSGGTLTTWGYREQLDVRAMVDWLEREKHPSWIAAMGNSMGAATVLAEATDDDRVRALILDSMHGSVIATLGDGLEYERHVPGYPTAWAMVGMASLKMGADLSTVDPVRTIGGMAGRPVLLIHGRADHLDRPERSAEVVFAAALEAGVAAELHYCDAGTHGRLIEACPDGWPVWVNDFVGAALELSPAAG